MKGRKFKNISTPFDIKVLYIIISGILIAGIINYFIEGLTISPSVVYTRSLRSQTIVETIVYLVIVLLGLSGASLLYRIDEQKPKRISALYFTIGIILLLLASIMPYWMWLIKLY
jgi:uncharacterized membrane protein